MIVHRDGEILLIRRGREPFKGQWAVPGGFVEHGETVENAATREIMEETGVMVKLVDILGVYSDPTRDPRDHHISIVFVAEFVSGKAQGGDDAAQAEWVSLDSIGPNDLAFDHYLILRDFRTWLQDGGTFWSTKTR